MADFLRKSDTLHLFQEAFVSQANSAFVDPRVSAAFVNVLKNSERDWLPSTFFARHVFFSCCFLLVTASCCELAGPENQRYFVENFIVSALLGKLKQERNGPEAEQCIHLSLAVCNTLRILLDTGVAIALLL